MFRRRRETKHLALSMIKLQCRTVNLLYLDSGLNGVARVFAWVQIMLGISSTSNNLLLSPQTSTFLPRCMECRRGLTMRFLSVCLSVCRSVCQTRALWQNGRKICLDFYIIRKNIYPSFLRRRMVGGGNPFYLKFWVNQPALERNRRFWTDNRS